MVHDLPGSFKRLYPEHQLGRLQRHETPNTIERCLARPSVAAARSSRGDLKGSPGSSKSQWQRQRHLVEPETTLEPELPKLAVADDKMVVFEPGQRPWAKPDCATEAFPGDDTRDELVHHLFFMPTSSYSTRLEYSLGRVSTPIIATRSANGHPFEVFLSCEEHLR